MELSDYRARIDQIDRQLVELFAQRMNTAAGIAAYKKEHGLPVLDPVREREKLLDVAAQAPEDMRDYTASLYTMLFELSRCYQGRLLGSTSPLTTEIQTAIDQTPNLFPSNVSVACQGVAGAYSQLACDKLFKLPHIMYFASFEAVFAAIERGLCRYGVLPLENSTAGSVNAIYDLMMKHDFRIVRSVRLKVDHNLLVKPGTKRSDITEIYSHQQALSQCEQYLQAFPGVKIIPCENTAVAAQKVAEADGRRRRPVLPLLHEAVRAGMLWRPGCRIRAATSPGSSASPRIWRSTPARTAPASWRCCLTSPAPCAGCSPGSTPWA